jgi:hypothetical protein
MYIKKLALVAALAVASFLWLPLLSCRAVLAAINWAGMGARMGLKHKDTGVKLASLLGLTVIGLPWLVAIGGMLLLATYEIGCFKLMNALFVCEDIGYRPQGREPEPPPQRGLAVRERTEGRVMQLPSARQTLSEVQAQQVALRAGWNPEALDYTWDSRRQLWRSKDGQLVDHDGSHVAWAS